MSPGCTNAASTSQHRRAWSSRSGSGVCACAHLVMTSNKASRRTDAERGNNKEGSVTKRTAPTAIAEPEQLSGTVPVNAADIARRAYPLYEARGAEPGRDLDDWLRAERELQQRSEPQGE